MTLEKIKTRYEEVIIGILRIAMGIVFIWPFFDKLLGLGFSTAAENAWINGGSPTQGFLLFATNQNSPFASIFTEILGPNYQIIDFIFMAMLLVVGVSLITGLLVNISSLAGIVFMVNVLLAEWYIYNPGTPVFNPLIDEHVIYIIILLFFIIVPAGKYLGLGKRWSELSFVRKTPFRLLN
ncbi:MAG: hypothetical protein ACW98I_12425 [Candidatus Hodarchaeales archaeon]|jgi:thiosulfate dehydrogenase [quinone] large subunit